VLCYPLIGRGERLPFVSGDAEGFLEPEVTDKIRHMAALFEGLAFVEKWAYELLESLSVKTGDTVFSTGGCVRNGIYNLIRASVLEKNVAIPSNTESAFGSAVMAASRAHFSSAAEAASSMVKIKRIIEPDRGLARAYDERYGAWRELCRRKGLA
jgi:xylulokinase